MYTCILQYPLLKSIVCKSICTSVYGMHIVCTMHSSLFMHSTVSCITCMHFQCFKEKHCTLIVFHNKIFPKNWGGQMHYWPPPQSVLWGGGHGPPDPPPPWRTPWYEYTSITISVNINLLVEDCGE